MCGKPFAILHHFLLIFFLPNGACCALHTVSMNRDLPNLRASLCPRLALQIFLHEETEREESYSYLQITWESLKHTTCEGGVSDHTDYDRCKGLYPF